MKIAMIAPPWFPLPPRGYGGIELVVSQLTEGLVARGHEVTLFASGDSHTRADLSYVFDQAPSMRMGMGHLEIMHSMSAYTRASEFDLIHDHDGFASRAMGALVHHILGVPVLATLHGPADPPTQESLAALRDDLCFIAISEYQRHGFPDLRFAGTIPNAIAVDQYPFTTEKDDYLLFVGRMSPDKGAHTAIRVAEHTGQQPRNGIHQDQSGQFAARQHVIAYGDFIRYQVSTNAFVHSFVTTADQRDFFMPG